MCHHEVRRRVQIPQTPGVATPPATGLAKDNAGGQRHDAWATPRPGRPGWMAAEVPAPTRWLGTIVQWKAADEQACRQEVLVLRMDGTRAMVAAANRGSVGRRASTGLSPEEMAARPWRAALLFRAGAGVVTGGMIPVTDRCHTIYTPRITLTASPDVYQDTACNAQI